MRQMMKELIDMNKQIIEESTKNRENAVIKWKTKNNKSIQRI